ncbi:MAG TPA: hypothetical protein VL551_11455 [Actinospica sp.]|nr:hypothetical protein [Actinospica sp.]
MRGLLGMLRLLALLLAIAGLFTMQLGLSHHKSAAFVLEALAVGATSAAAFIALMRFGRR